MFSTGRPLYTCSLAWVQSTTLYTALKAFTGRIDCTCKTMRSHLLSVTQVLRTPLELWLLTCFSGSVCSCRLSIRAIQVTVDQSWDLLASLWAQSEAWHSSFYLDWAGCSSEETLTTTLSSEWHLVSFLPLFHFILSYYFGIFQCSGQKLKIFNV